MVVKEEVDLDTQRFLSKDPNAVEISDSHTRKVEFNGLSKDEVMALANDPKWVRIRWALFVLFWVVWVTMLVAAVLIVVVDKKCPYRPKQVWWEKEAVYQVDIGKFADASGDGVGDIQGLVAKLDYLEKLNIRTLNFQTDFFAGGGVSQMNPSFGTVDDLNALKKALAEKNMRIVLDVDINDLKGSNKDVILNEWLKKYADGIRVVGFKGEEDEAKIFEDLAKDIKTIEEKTFKSKLLSFYPPTDSFANSSMVRISNKLLEIDAETFVNAEKYVNKLKEMYAQDTSKTLFYAMGVAGEARTSERLGSASHATLFDPIALLLKGNALVLYGDEIRLAPADPYMKWDKSSLACGFGARNISRDCSGSVKESLAHGSGETLLNVYQRLLRLKAQQPSMNWGRIEFANNATASAVVAYQRVADRFPAFVVAANTGPEAHLVDFTRLFATLPAADAETKVEYFYAADGRRNDDFAEGNVVQCDSINMKPGEFLILKYDTPDTTPEVKKSAASH